MKLASLTIIAVLLASPTTACQDGANVCDGRDPSPGYDVPQGNYHDADRDDGRTFEDVTEPEPSFDNGRDRGADQDGDAAGGSSGDLDNGRG